MNNSEDGPEDKTNGFKMPEEFRRRLNNSPAMKDVRRRLIETMSPITKEVTSQLDEALNPMLQNLDETLYGERAESMAEEVDPEFLMAVGYFFLAASEAEAGLGYLLRNMNEDPEPPLGLGWQSGKSLVKELEKSVEKSTLADDVKQRIIEAYECYNSMSPTRNQLTHGTFLFKPRNPSLEKGVFTDAISSFPLMSAKRATPEEVVDRQEDIIQPMSVEDLMVFAKEYEALADEVRKINELLDDQ